MNKKIEHGDFVLTSNYGWGKVIEAGNHSLRMNPVTSENNAVNEDEEKVVNLGDVDSIRKSRDYKSFKTGDLLRYNIDHENRGRLAGTVDGNYKSDPNRFVFNNHEGWIWGKYLQLHFPVEATKDIFDDVLIDSVVEFEYIKQRYVPTLNRYEEYEDTKRIILKKNEEKTIEGVYDNDTDEYRRFLKSKIKNFTVLKQPFMLELRDLLNKTANWVKSVNESGIQSITDPNLERELRSYAQQTQEILNSKNDGEVV